jgi:hypothetical protein
MTPKQTKPMCCVSIDYRSYLMPADVGMKLVALLNHAVECDRKYTEPGHRYHVKEAPEVAYVSVRPDQIVFPAGAPAQRRLT